jgi:hypothetical protein
MAFLLSAWNSYSRHLDLQIANLVRGTVENELGAKPALEIHHIKGIRNCKVSTERARNVLSFHLTTTFVPSFGT